MVQRPNQYSISPESRHCGLVTGESRPARVFAVGTGMRGAFLLHSACGLLQNLAAKGFGSGCLSQHAAKSQPTH